MPCVLKKTFEWQQWKFSPDFLSRIERASEWDILRARSQRQFVTFRERKFKNKVTLPFPFLLGYFFPRENDRNNREKLVLRSCPKTMGWHQINWCQFSLNMELVFLRLFVFLYDFQSLYVSSIIESFFFQLNKCEDCVISSGAISWRNFKVLPCANCV